MGPGKHLPWYGWQANVYSRHDPSATKTLEHYHPVSVKSLGAAGDGVTDDTKALQKVFDQVSKLIMQFQPFTQKAPTVCWLQVDLL